MFGAGRLGVGRRCHLLAGRFSRSALTLAGSAAGTSLPYQAGSYGPLRRSTAPGSTPYFLVPAASGAETSNLHSQSLRSASTSATVSSSATAARRTLLRGTTGFSLAG